MLCYVFEKFISVCLKDYGLNTSLNNPALSWDAMLKFTEIKLQKIDNIDMHLFLENEMRGGVNYISKRYSKVMKIKQFCNWMPIIYMDGP